MGLPIHRISDKPSPGDVDTITLYIKPDNQRRWYDFLLGLNPRRLIFNPGTENRELFEMARVKGIETLDACTLIMLNTGQY